MRPYEITIDVTARLNTVTVNRPINGEVMRAMNLELWAREDFDPSFQTLVFQSVSGFHDTSHEDFREVMEWTLENDPRTGAIAIVHLSGAADQPFERLIHALRGTIGLASRRALRHFTRAEDARAWLAAGAPPEGDPAP